MRTITCGSSDGSEDDTTGKGEGDRAADVAAPRGRSAGEPVYADEPRVKGVARHADTEAGAGSAARWKR